MCSHPAPATAKSPASVCLALGQFCARATSARKSSPRSRQITWHGGPLLRFKRSHLKAAGVERTTARVAGVRDGKPELDDGTVLDVANVIW
jgi:putative flavoprotein involved in K+ transport